MEHVQIFCVGETTISTIQVLDERVTSVALSLRDWLPSALTLLLAYVVLSAADCTTLLALKICIAYKRHL